MESAACPAGLFDGICLAVAKECELRQTRNILFVFLFLLLASLLALPFSLSFLMAQWQTSGIGYFIGAAASNPGAFFSLWPDFSLSIIEALPLEGIILFSINLALLLFTVRLFLHRQGLILTYFQHAAHGK
jgi:hypothetical protein